MSNYIGRYRFRRLPLTLVFDIRAFPGSAMVGRAAVKRRSQLGHALEVARMGSYQSLTRRRGQEDYLDIRIVLVALSSSNRRPIATARSGPRSSN